MIILNCPICGRPPQITVVIADQGDDVVIDTTPSVLLGMDEDEYADRCWVLDSKFDCACIRDGQIGVRQIAGPEQNVIAAFQKLVFEQNKLAYELSLISDDFALSSNYIEDESDNEDFIGQ